jgi:DNA uptake protein ComE-like DNA-binding protein
LPFNPNELSRKQAEELGLPDYVIDNILKYRQEGGHFEEPSDFAELYGLADSTFQKLKPYIRLPDQQASKKKQQNHQKESFQPDTLFAFNPNDLPIQKWRQLGLPDHIILNIKSYEEQGGYFKTKEDIADIYGMKQKVFAELAPYIQLDNKKNKDQDKRDKKKTSRPEKTAKVDVNNADSLDLLNVKGIGPFYARMILQERRKLGGFVNKEQIKQIYGMQKKYGDDSLTVYQNIKDRLIVGPAQPKQIDINAATVDRLADHPYIDYNLAENIVNYRKQHGPYDSLADVNQLYLVNDDLSRKLAPYLQLP